MRSMVMGVFLTTVFACSGKQEETATIRPPLRESKEVLNVRYTPLDPAPRTPLKIVLFPREEGNGNKMIASAWDFDPEKPEAGFVRRVEFGESSWNATLLFWSTSEAPEFVRLQVNGPTNLGYIVHFYHINYRTWEVKLLLKTDQVTEMGANENTVYISTDQGHMEVDRSTLKLRPLVPDFKVVGWFEPLWLVEMQDAKGAFFDLRAGKLSEERFAIPATWKQRGFVLDLSPDRRNVAVWDHEYRSDPKSRSVKYGESIMLTGALEIHDLAKGKSQSLPFRARCSGGSGVRIISHGPVAEWLDNGKTLRFQSRSGTNLEAGLEQITIDGETMAVISREPVSEARDHVFIPPDPVPEFLKADYEALEGRSTEQGRRTALAFLRRHGVDVRELRDYPDTSVLFSPDRTRFLLRINPPKPAMGDCFFGDLAADTLRRVAAPPAIARVPVDIAWVSVPAER